MKKTLNIDEKMLQGAKAACGVSTDTELSGSVSKR
jgi:hypothetical protein